MPKNEICACVCLGVGIVLLLFGIREDIIARVDRRQSLMCWWLCFAFMFTVFSLALMGGE